MKKQSFIFLVLGASLCAQTFLISTNSHTLENKDSSLSFLTGDTVLNYKKADEGRYLINDEYIATDKNFKEIDDTEPKIFYSTKTTNIRQKPTVDSPILRTVKGGPLEVLTEVEFGWLALKGGGFVAEHLLEKRDTIQTKLQKLPIEATVNGSYKISELIKINLKNTLELKDELKKQARVLNNLLNNNEKLNLAISEIKEASEAELNKIALTVQEITMKVREIDSTSNLQVLTEAKRSEE